MKQRMMNPILNPDIFVPDAEAHVWDDGRIYLYGSFDIAGRNTYCSGEYHVYSSADLVNWVDHGVAFHIRQVTWAPGHTTLYAPDCAYRNGIYYLYYCLPGGRNGVAQSQTPYGPFEDIGPIEHVTMIDPAVFIDDDDQAYLYWGQFDGVRVAKLKENMTEIDPDTITQPLSVAEHEFHEGSSVKKIGGKYYYLFTDTHRHGGKATSLGYAVSDHPMTGFEYKGVIIDNFGCDPETWNNHGSIAEFNGQWYIFYHRSTHCSKYSRHVCMEPIFFNPDGTISEVKMTTSAGEVPIAASAMIEAHRACEVIGSAHIAGNALCEHGFVLRATNSFDGGVYRYLSFSGEDAVSITLKADRELQIELLTEAGKIGAFCVNASNGYSTITANIPPVSGTHTLILKLIGNFASAEVVEFTFFHTGGTT